MFHDAMTELKDSLSIKNKVVWFLLHSKFRELSNFSYLIHRGQKHMNRFFYLSANLLCVVAISVSYAQNTSRFTNWKIPSFYRGFDFTEDSHIKDQGDFLEYAKTGATFAYICC